jgi:hypothetical protein
VTGVSSTFTSSSPQLGQFEVGALASAIGPQPALLAGGVLVALLATAMGALGKSVRDLEIRGSSVIHSRVG